MYKDSVKGHIKNARNQINDVIVNIRKGEMPTLASAEYTKEELMSALDSLEPEPIDELRFEKNFIEPIQLQSKYITLRHGEKYHRLPICEELTFTTDGEPFGEGYAVAKGQVPVYIACEAINCMGHGHTIYSNPEELARHLNYYYDYEFTTNTPIWFIVFVYLGDV